jgi:uncharacterized repeat protein (TIGR01451 family)
MDAMSFDGGQFYGTSEGATKISGQLYRWNQPSGVPLSRKQRPTLAVSGGYPLADISGPASSLGDDVADSYKYCVALLAGECTAGSLPGQVFVNAPNVQYLNCLGSDGPQPQNLDICIGNLSTYSQAITQMVMGSDSDDSNRRSRVISYGLSGIRNSFNYWTAKSLPDASWALFTRGVAPPFGDLLTVWMAKLPPLAAPDGVDRSTFLPVTISLAPPANRQIAKAIIQFGYAEQGAPNQYYCTSRREPCVAASQGFIADNPFQYALSETYSGVPCSVSCQITIPVLPMHVVYYQARYLDSSDQLVALGERGMAAEFKSITVDGTAGKLTPVIASVSPASGVAGTSVTLAGSNFGSSQDGCTVTFNGTPATVTSWSATSIAVSVPAGASTGNVAVTVGGVASNGMPFTVPTPVPAVLAIAMSHSGSFTQGQTNATYTVSVSNAAWAGPTSGTVTVSESLPSGLILVSMSGAGWTCQSGATVCTRSDVLIAGATYPSITMTVNVGVNAASPLASVVSVSGGGSAVANATDPTIVVAAGGASAPVLSTIAPISGAQGRTLQVTLSGTNFATGATVTTNNPGLAVSATTVVNDMQIIATFTIAADAKLGAAKVSVTTSGGNSSPVVFIVNPAR